MCDRKYSISEIWHGIQRVLFPFWEEELGHELCESHRLLIEVIEVVRPERFLSKAGCRRLGAPEKDRRKIVCAFLAKAVLNLPTTKALRERLIVDGVLRRLCGWERRKDIPSESTFSRAFATFAETGLLDEIHAALAQSYLGDAVVWHISRDGTAIVGREKPASKSASKPASAPSPAISPEGTLTLIPPEEPSPVPRSEESATEIPAAEASPGPETAVSATARETPDRKALESESPTPPARRRRGRPRKGEVVPPKEPTRLQKQRTQTLPEILKELPDVCDVGTKKDVHGHKDSWIGFAMHADVTERGVPTAAITTSASLHDSQVAIPLDRQTHDRVGTIFYELMDSAYDAKEIDAEVAETGSVAIIDRNRRRGPKPPPMEPDRARQYRGRSASERFNSDLKDNHGGRTVRVRGGAKVHTHLMFGVLVIFVKAILGIFRP